MTTWCSSCTCFADFVHGTISVQQQNHVQIEGYLQVASHMFSCQPKSGQALQNGGWDGLCRHAVHTMLPLEYAVIHESRKDTGSLLDYRSCICTARSLNSCV